MRAFVAEIPRREKRRAATLKAAANELMALVVTEHMRDVRDGFADLPAVLEHLAAMERHITDNPSDWGPSGGGSSGPLGALALPEGGDDRDPLIRRYGVHVLVDRRADHGAPVVYEPHPTFENLVGAMDHIPVLGALVTDIHLIKPGALHRAPATTCSSTRAQPPDPALRLGEPARSARSPPSASPSSRWRDARLPRRRR
ncbi:MAG: AAA family ATPase [Myxococcota bacterium]